LFFACIEGYNPAEIVREIFTQFEIKINPSSIADTCKAKIHQTTITHFRQQYLADVRAVPIANKRIHIIDLEKSF